MAVGGDSNITVRQTTDTKDIKSTSSNKRLEDAGCHIIEYITDLKMLKL